MNDKNCYFNKTNPNEGLTLMSGEHKHWRPYGKIENTEPKRHKIKPHDNVIPTNIVGILLSYKYRQPFICIPNVPNKIIESDKSQNMGKYFAAIIMR